LYSTIIKYVFYPLREKLQGTRILKYLKELEETQWWSNKELQEMQNKKLQSLIKHAYANVPYYRKIFNERGLVDKDIQTIDDLYKLPILTKDDIRQNFENMQANDFKKWAPSLKTTGGSTGEPLMYYITQDAFSINLAGIFRGLAWAGYKFGDKKITLGGSRLVSDKRQTIKGWLVNKLIDRNLSISTLDMSEEKVNKYVCQIKKYKPKFVYGYASALYLIANYLKQNKINIIQPVAIFSTAEMLLPHYRKEIEDVFKCEVFDFYGTFDGGPQALECPTHNGYHVSSEKAIMEFLDDNGKPVSPGNPGEIITTDLHNYAMPFIRYAVGDIATPTGERCSCGRGLPFINSIEGRTLDFILLPDGSKVRGSRLIDVFYENMGEDYIRELATIKQFQVIQDSLDELVVLIIQDASPTIEETEYIKSELIKALNYPMNINIEFVDTIPQTKAGKKKYIVSNIH
jgi:phenylacetate-CoA ligase